MCPAFPQLRKFSYEVDFELPAPPIPFPLHAPISPSSPCAPRFHIFSFPFPSFLVPTSPPGIHPALSLSLPLSASPFQLANDLKIGRWGGWGGDRPLSSNFNPPPPLLPLPRYLVGTDRATKKNAEPPGTGNLKITPTNRHCSVLQLLIFCVQVSCQFKRGT